MTIQVSERPFILGNRAREAKFLPISTLSKGRVIAFWWEGASAGRETIVSTDHLSRERSPLRSNCPAQAPQEKKDLKPLKEDRGEFSTCPPGLQREWWGTWGPGSCKGGQHCVDRGSRLGRLYFGRGTQLTVRPGEWVVFYSRETSLWRNRKGRWMSSLSPETKGTGVLLLPLSQVDWDGGTEGRAGWSGSLSGTWESEKRPCSSPPQAKEKGNPTRVWCIPKQPLWPTPNAWGRIWPSGWVGQIEVQGLQGLFCWSAVILCQTPSTTFLSRRTSPSYSVNLPWEASSSLP